MKEFWKNLTPETRQTLIKFGAGAIAAILIASMYFGYFDEILKAASQ